MPSVIGSTISPWLTEGRNSFQSWFNCMCQSFGKAPFIFMVEFIVKGQSCRPAWLNWVPYWIACLTSVDNGVLAKEHLNAGPDQRSRSCDLQPEERADRKSGSVHCLPFPIVLKVHRSKQVISRGLFGLAPISKRKIDLMKGLASGFGLFDFRCFGCFLGRAVRTSVWRVCSLLS